MKYIKVDITEALHAHIKRASEKSKIEIRRIVALALTREINFLNDSKKLNEANAMFSEEK